MTMNIISYAAPSDKSELSSYQFERHDPRSDDVVIEGFMVVVNKQLELPIVIIRKHFSKIV